MTRSEVLKARWADPDARQRLLDSRVGKRVYGPSPARKFTNDEVREIRFLHRCGVTQKELAAQFGCSQPTISLIIRRVNYAEVL